MKKFLKVSLIICAICFALLIIYIIWGYDNSLTKQEYEFQSRKLSSDVKIAFVSDLHGTEFGENNIELLEMIGDYNPDLVLLGGDMFDKEESFEESCYFIAEIAKQFPVYAAMGNHEYKCEGHSASELRKLYGELGVTLLENEAITTTVGKEKINICGANPFEGVDDWSDKTVENVDSDYYTLVINHRPDLWTAFENKGIDLVLSGHAHGGQWVVPGILNGLLAPNQGLFPEYAGGLYEFDDGMSLVVSRGLAVENTIVPRVFNPPELVLIKLN